MRTAKPQTLPRAAEGHTVTSSPTSVPSEVKQSGKPTYTGPDQPQRFFPAQKIDDNTADAGAAPPAAGTSGQPFTNSRVVPIANLKTLFPQRTVGKLFFTAPDGTNFVCSASVIRHKLISTAGHCIYDTVVNQFNSNFLFVPGLQNGVGPYGSWTWTNAVVSGVWVAGSGSVPNAGDFGVILLANKVVGSGSPKRIGDVTGFLGYKTNAILGNQLTVVGYPCNLDSCNLPQRTDAQSEVSAAPNTAQLGSDSRGGVSGGPWVQDWGNGASGQPAREGNGNLTTGVTSYGPTSTTPRYLGASIFNSDWVNVFNTGCAQQPLACS